MKPSRGLTVGLVALIATLLALLALQHPRPVPLAPEERGDASFRKADHTLQREFADTKTRRQRGELSAAGYATAVSALRTRELELFAAVRRHHFEDLTESNYWHRGRLKFPGVIEMEWRALRESDPAALPP